MAKLVSARALVTFSTFSQDPRPYLASFFLLASFFFFLHFLLSFASSLFHLLFLSHTFAGQVNREGMEFPNALRPFLRWLGRLSLFPFLNPKKT